MAFFEKKQVKKAEYSMFKNNDPKLLMEQLKGDVELNEGRFNKDLGDEHPFDYKITSGLYKKFGFTTSVVDKIVDFVWGPGVYTLSDDERSKAVIDQWMDDVDFDSVGREWLRQALIKGFSPMELGGKLEEAPQAIKILNSDRVFVKRDKKGKVLYYNQVKAGTKSLANVSKESIIVFKPYQIAQLNMKQIEESAYGLGILFPTVSLVNQLFGLQSNMNSLMRRKANSPIVAYLGDKENGELPSQADVDAFGEKLQFMNNQTEWVFGDNARLEVLNFGSIGEKFDFPINHYMDLLIFSYQVPEVILGKGSVPEGLAKVQLDTFERMIKSIQVEVEKVIENQIFLRVLKANGLQASVELEWGEPSQDDKNIRINQIVEILKNPYLTFKVRNELEMELAKLMGLKPENFESSEEERRKEEEEDKQPIVPGSNASELYEGVDIRKNW